MRQNAQGLLVPACSGEELLLALPDLNDTHISTEQLSNIASAHLTSSIWLDTRRAIIAACADELVTGVVLVQGTDTLEETAFFLDAALSKIDTRNKTIVLTGAMRNADEANTDGPQNLYNAIQLASTQFSKAPPVLVTMYGQIHAARAVQKQNSTDVDAFDSVHHSVFGQFGHDGQIELTAIPVDIHTPFIKVDAELRTLPKVDIIPFYVGADAAMLNASIANGAKALVIQAVGAGNLNPTMFAGVEHAIQSVVPVIIATRCWEGCAEPHYGYIGGGQTLAKIGACFAHDLPAHKARIYAQLLLSQNHDSATTHLSTGFANLVSGI